MLHSSITTLGGSFGGGRQRPFVTFIGCHDLLGANVPSGSAASSMDAFGETTMGGVTLLRSGN